MSRKTKSENYIVYKHTNTQNGKIYVGITSADIDIRAGRNGHRYKKNTLFYRAIKKYGWQAFEHEIIKSGLTFDEAAEMEVATIMNLRSNNPEYGYNISSGGESGHAGCSMSEEERECRSQKMRGTGNPYYGVFGEAHPAYGTRRSAEARSRIGFAHKGKTMSDAAKEKLSSTKKSNGDWHMENNPMYGKRYGAAPHAKPVICIDTNQVYSCVKEAAESVGVSPTCMTKCCKGKQHTCAGLHWNYADNCEGVIDNAS